MKKQGNQKALESKIFMKDGIYKKYFKRPLDLFCSSLALVVLSPLLLLIAVLVRVNLGSPILFKQTRIGLNEKPFTLFKFRTMTNKTDEKGDLLPDSIRLPKFGRFLRSTSLDELPELFNILKGDMSVIGPRPLPLQYLAFYTEEERLRHSIRPGLSGLAQINGRNILNWEERFALDIQYFKNISLKGDISIILKTLINTFQMRDIGERGLDSPLDFDIYRTKQMTRKDDTNEH